MRRLEELLRQMCQAAKAIGNTDLENKFAGGNNIIMYFLTVHTDKLMLTLPYNMYSVVMNMR